MIAKARVYKFGGASVKDAESVINMASIVADADPSAMVIVVSAMGKMTNALERLTRSYIDQLDDLAAIFEEVKGFHWNIATALFEPGDAVFGQINDLLVEIEWIIEDDPQDGYDYLYDQIVSVGEFLSTTIVSSYLNKAGVANTLLDVRDVLKTDNAHREARVDWQWTEQLIGQQVSPMLENGDVLITQGFVGCTSENFNSTLGS